VQRQFVMTTRKSQIYREALTLSRYRMMDQSRKRPYRPNGIRPEVWERAAPSVFEWDGLSAPHSRYPRRLRLYAYSRLAAHCDAQGFPITAEIAFSLETINACVAAQPLVSTSKANLRSWLMEGRQFVLRIPGEPSRTQNPTCQDSVRRLLLEIFPRRARTEHLIDVTSYCTSGRSRPQW